MSTSIGIHSPDSPLKQLRNSGVTEIAEKAKKQLDDTGSLKGFSADYTASTGDETVTVSISSVAASAYDKSATSDQTILLLKYTTSEDGIGITGGGGATSLVIKGDADIDDAATYFDGGRPAQYIEPVPDENSAPKLPAPASAAPATAKASPSAPAAAPSAASKVAAKLLTAAQQQQDNASQLINTLQGFLDKMRASKGDLSKTSTSQAQNGTQATLKNMLGTLDVSV
jgi:pyruvate/2-oxoglutarate dehydrogenase complex dihydrolipoamide acyltransferase (E2) component